MEIYTTYLNIKDLLVLLTDPFLKVFDRRALFLTEAHPSAVGVGTGWMRILLLNVLGQFEKGTVLFCSRFYQSTSSSSE